MNFEEFCLPLSGDPRPGCLIVNKRIPEPGCPGLEFTSIRKLRARDGLAGGDRGGTSRYVQKVDWLTCTGHRESVSSWP
jgi:hypothetical protein